MGVSSQLHIRGYLNSETDLVSSWWVSVTMNQDQLINLLIPTKLPKALAASLEEMPVSTKAGITSKTFKTGPCLCYLGT